ncbi:hypothetical protein [Hymenobacter sp. BRD67]|uniref:hypothetical protein n=1 Tax=Hymenobacter sp. BRD67 TaxID=2675877 RepID=UPI001567A0F9|nr:hypothetical protein [Hymenobacter sp. BRD67]QKG51839.1 hypothetical protein GKZ67_03490 [Hymenobacter sp. BRD67]
MTHTIFYSWQSDSPKETNQQAIRLALRDAADQLEQAATEPKTLTIDEATRGTSGSPNIPQTIFSKIDTCDAFVCDLTTIAISAGGKAIANPNVLIELGYAVATLGWERIVLLFNKQHGNFPIDLPFDVDRHRASPFTIQDRKDKAGKADLVSVLQTALNEIITQVPLRPAERKIMSPAQQERAADVRVLTSTLETINIADFDHFLDEFPERLPKSVFYYREAFLRVVERSTFFLYNRILLSKLEVFKKNWGKSLNYAQHYYPDAHTDFYKYHIPGDAFPSEKSRKDFTHLTRHRTILQKSFRELLDYVRLNYLEVNVNELSDQALANYRDYLAS